DVNGLFLVVKVMEERAVLELHLREERSQTVVIRLGPAVAGMVVAASALEADSQKELRNGLHSHLGIPQPAVKARRRMGVIPTPRLDELADEHILGQVDRHGVGDPLVVLEGSHDPDETLIAPEAVRPVHPPKLSRLGPVEKLIDEPASL